MKIDIPSPPPEGCISCEVRGHVLLIGVNRPAKRNGWTPAMFQQLAQAYTRLDDEPELRVGLLHAFGEHFTAGLDLPLIAEFMKTGQKVIPPGLVEPHDYGLPGYRRRAKPMVAAVKGICFTVGIELMLGADVMVKPYLEQGHLQRVLAGWTGPEYEFNAVFPRGHVQSPKVRAFVDFLVERMKFDVDYMMEHCPVYLKQQAEARAAAEAAPELEAAAAVGRKVLADALS